jgi:hypothetical protein
MALLFDKNPTSAVWRTYFVPDDPRVGEKGSLHVLHRWKLRLGRRKRK